MQGNYKQTASFHIFPADWSAVFKVASKLVWSILEPVKLTLATSPWMLEKFVPSRMQSSNLTPDPKEQDTKEAPVRLQLMKDAV